MTNTILQITKVDEELVKELLPSFDRLPETDHADGNYRLRKYSHVSCNMSHINIATRMESDFIQSKKYNKHQGGMQRKFEHIEDEVLNSQCLSEMIAVFGNTCHLPERFEMDIHQMRVKCIGGATQLSPEGWHQDGYDCICMVGIQRCNIFGGHVLLATSKTEDPFFKGVLDPGTMVIVDDSHLWHNGRSVQPINDEKPAYMDVMVFTAKKYS